MKNRTIILAALALFTLGACSAVDQMGSDVDQYFGFHNTVNGEGSTDGRNWVDQYGNPVSPPTEKVGLSYNTIAGKLATFDSSVQMFSLDDAAPLQQAPDQYGSPVMDPSGMASGLDPSVTVFPFSDDTNNSMGASRRVDRATNNGDMSGVDMVPLYTGNPNTIYFEHGSSALSASARQIIARVARSYSTGMVMIDGHASRRTGVQDPVRAEMINYQMSMKRAMGVMNKLMSQGVPAESMKVTAHGDAELAVPETGRKAEKKNRRVEIHTGQF